MFQIPTVVENEEFLHTKIRNLQSDITNLLELIRRAREENSWDVTGLVFTELTFDDVFDVLPLHYGYVYFTLGSFFSSTLNLFWDFSM